MGKNVPLDSEDAAIRRIIKEVIEEKMEGFIKRMSILRAIDDTFLKQVDNRATDIVRTEIHRFLSTQPIPSSYRDFVIGAVRRELADSRTAPWMRDNL